MNELIEQARVSAKGGIELSMGMAMSTAISAIGTIIVARLLTPEEFGLYTIAMVPGTMIGLFRDWGVYSAVTRYISFFRARSQECRVKQVIRAGLSFSLISGLVSAIFTFLISDLVAELVFKKLEAAILIKASALWVFSMAIFNMGWSSLIGFERMSQNSLVIITRSIIKSVASPLLILLGYGALGAVLGYGISILLASILCQFFVFRAFAEIETKSEDSLVKTLALLLRYGFPLGIGMIVSGFGTQFYRFLMSRSCSPEAIGNYSVATNFLVAMNLINSPIVTVLFPAFSKIDGGKRVEDLKKAFRASVKYSSVFVVPVAMWMIIAARPLVQTFFGEKYPEAPAFLSLISIANLLCLVGSLSSGSLLTSQGRTSEIMKANLASLAVGIPLSSFLIPRFKIYGLIFTTLTALTLSIAVLGYRIYRIYGFSVDFVSSARILVASSLMGAFILLIERLIRELNPLLRVLIEGPLGALIYSILILVFKGLSWNELERLKLIFGRAGLAGKIVTWFLNGLETLSRLMRLH